MFQEEKNFLEKELEKQGRKAKRVFCFKRSFRMGCSAS
jgi:hypothetical protein